MEWNTRVWNAYVFLLASVRLLRNVDLLNMANAHLYIIISKVVTPDCDRNGTALALHRIVFPGFFQNDKYFYCIRNKS